MKAFVCMTCRNGGEGFAKAIAKALQGLADVEPSACMSGCSRDQTLAFRAPGKVAYLFGDLGLADLPDLQNFARLYAASMDGHFEDARVLGNLRLKAVARIPA